MTKLEELQKAKTLNDLAKILGYKPSRLSYLLYHLPNEQKYTAFTIPKRDGTVREILAPVPKIKFLQRRLANLLYQILEDIKECHPSTKTLSHGFSKGSSIITNANVHKRRRYVLNFDLKDFFPSINFGRVRGIFINDKRFALNPKIATLIAQISCYDNVLPQGSPCSPVISNIIGHLLDIRLVAFARKYKCTYSRYADDITFSTNIKNFPSRVAALKPGSMHEWELSNTLLKLIHKSGFSVNPSKTRMQYRGSRQVTTGLLVNEKPNILPEYYRTVRAMCHSLFKTGTYYKINNNIKEEIISLAPLEGMLAYIYHVRNFNKKEAHKHTMAGIYKIYRDFLFYKNFIKNPQPIILTEGKTDSIYLRCAIERLAISYPRLATIENKKYTFKVSFMNYSKMIKKLFNIGDGVTNFPDFINEYCNHLKKYKNNILLNPVIILVDNDNASDGVFKVAKKNNANLNISLESNKDYYRISRNLYLIKTPEDIRSQEMKEIKKSKNKHETIIEDMFDFNLFKTEIRGKIFDFNKKNKEHEKYGKNIFAEEVVKLKRNEIDFSKFEKLLNRIVSVIEHYEEINSDILEGA